MVKSIIKMLNDQYGGLTSGSQVFGLAHSMLRIQGSVREILPCVIQRDGEGRYVGFDDVNKLMIYHKLLSAGSTQSLNGKGDNPGDLVNTYTLAMIVTWDRKSLDVMADEMLMLVQANTPVIVKGIPDTKLVRIRIVGANLDPLQVFAQEYQSENAKLPGNILLVQINYTIELTFNPACVKACP